MKANKIIKALGIVLLMSPMVLRSVVSTEVAKPTLTRGTVMRSMPVTEDPWESSDEEIMAGQQFTGPIHEKTVRGLPRFRRTDPSFREFSKHYGRWTTVEHQGAASEFKPRKQS